MNFHSFQGGLKATEPYHSDICHVRRALGSARQQSGEIGSCRDVPWRFGFSRAVLIGSRRPAPGRRSPVAPPLGANES